MYGSRRPNNWYEMDYSERQAWERQEQERQDLEYDKQRAQEEASQAQDEARRSRLNAQREMAAMSEDYGYQMDDLNSQIEKLEKDKADLLEVLEKVVTQMIDDAGKPLNLVVVHALEVIHRVKGE